MLAQLQLLDLSGVRILANLMGLYHFLIIRSFSDARSAELLYSINQVVLAGSVSITFADPSCPTVSRLSMLSTTIYQRKHCFLPNLIIYLSALLIFRRPRCTMTYSTFLGHSCICCVDVFKGNGCFSLSYGCCCAY